MLAGLSTLGAKVSVGFETVAGQKPTDFVVRHRINSIGGISIEPETIDASALEDFVERSVAGRATSGGNFTVAFNATDDYLMLLGKLSVSTNVGGSFNPLRITRRTLHEE